MRGRQLVGGRERPAERLREHVDGDSAITLAATNRVQAVLGGFLAGLCNAIHQEVDVRVVGSMAEEAPRTRHTGSLGPSPITSPPSRSSRVRASPSQGVLGRRGRTSRSWRSLVHSSRFHA